VILSPTGTAVWFALARAVTICFSTWPPTYDEERTMTGPGDLQHGSSVLELARAIQSDIEAGRYRHQEQLPSTRTLAAKWKTSTATVTRAMQSLEKTGLVINRDRAARFVNYPGPDQQQPARTRPTVLIVGGYAGSGKTEIGRIFTRLTGWSMLDKDSITRPVVEAMLSALGQSPHDRESDTYLDRVRPAEYEALREVTTENVACGNSVVTTAPYVRELKDPVWCARTVAEMDALDASVRTIWVRSDADSMLTYIRRRGAARDAVKLANWDNYVAGLDLNYTPAMEHTILDNSIQDPPLRVQAETLLTQWGVLPRR
jgi:predicted kinase